MPAVLRRQIVTAGIVALTLGAVAACGSSSSGGSAPSGSSSPSVKPDKVLPFQTQDQASRASKLARLSITNKNSKNVVNSGTIKAAARVA